MATLADNGQASAAQSGVAPRKLPPIETPPASPSHASARPDITRNMASTRASLDRNNLSPTRKAILNALAVEPDSAYTQQLHAELVH